MDRAINSPSALHKLLLTMGKHQQRNKGQVIQTTGDQKNFNLIKSGYIKRYLIANDGTLGVEAIYGPGDVFSITLAYKVLLGQELYDGPETYYFEAMNDCEIYSIDIDILHKHFEEKPLLYRDLMIESGKRMHTFAQGAENITMKTAYNRTAHQLLYYAKQFGKRTKSGVKIGVPLTHQDLANALSLSRETISINITTLRKKGLLRTNKYVYVLDMDKLQEEAYG